MKTVRYIFLLQLITAGFAAHSQQLDSFSLKDAVSGKIVNLSDFNSRTGLLIIFTNPGCPYDQYYTQRLASLSNDYKDKLPVLFVAAGDESSETEAVMKNHMAKQGLSGPMLIDRENKMMANLGATKSPEAFLLKNLGGKFTVVYKGAIDNNPQVATDVDSPYLKNALDQFLAGKAIDQPTTRPVGCSIR